MTRRRPHTLRRTLLISGACILFAGAVAAFLLWTRAAAPPTAGATRLGRGEIRQLLDSSPDRTLTFESFQGQRRCCDLGDPTLHFHADGTVNIEAHGFILEQRSAGFQISEDGRVELMPRDASTAVWLRTKRLGSAEVYRYGGTLYLAQAGGRFELPPKTAAEWPFRATANIP